MKEVAKNRDTSTPRLRCYGCASDEVEIDESIRVGGLEKVNFAWKVEGQAEISHCVSGTCKQCGQVLQAAERTILLRFPSLKCPDCHKREKLVCSVDGIKEKDGSFVFNAMIECKGRWCRFKKGVKKAAKSLFNISNIEVGPTGIKFKKGAA
jgi:hypothetical protein